MKLRKFGQAVLTTVVGIGLSFGLTSCVQSHTIGYFFVTGHQYNQVGSYKIDNNTGNLTAVAGSPFSSNGTNPVDAVVTSSGRFLYVLNAGCADPTVYPNAKYPCASGQTPAGSSIALFTIGGGGVISFQQSYVTQGSNTVTISTDATGSFLYALDQNVPNNPNIPAPYQQAGDISVFGIDGNTGRLQVVQNQQISYTNGGGALPFFPVGADPTWFAVYNGYVFTIDRGPTGGTSTHPSFVSVYSAPSTGQLVNTQNSEFPTGATDLSFVYGRGSYLYLLDAGDPNQPSNPALYNGTIYSFTVGSNGALASVTGGAQTQASLNYTSAVNPVAMLVESQNKFVYVANQGLNNGLTSAGSSIASYIIVSTTGQLQQIGGVSGGTINSGVGSGPRCVLEDPSNQFLYTANYNDSTMSGFILNSQAGTLTPQTKRSTTAAPGNPTWCVASGTTF